jgi:hypothetical protein
MALRYRAAAALAKGATTGVFGLWVLAITGWHAWHETLPLCVMAGFALQGALVVVRQSSRELRTARPAFRVPA